MFETVEVVHSEDAEDSLLQEQILTEGVDEKESDQTAGPGPWPL